MDFKKGEFFHIYNRGNNRDLIFYNHHNYLFFLEKLKTYILPYADIVAWCLMPNHFHLLVLVNEIELTVQTKNHINQRTFNHSIGIMLRSYTNAIQKQEGRTGALFQEETKAILLNDRVSFTSAYFNTVFGASITLNNDMKSYIETCFNYIHQNPVAAKLVQKAEDWEFSSFRDYVGLRNGKLINREIGKEFFILD